MLDTDSAFKKLWNMAGGIDKKKLNQTEDVNISTITTFNPNVTTLNEVFEADICLFAVNIYSNGKSISCFNFFWKFSVWQVKEKFQLESKKETMVQTAVINAIKITLYDPLTLVGWGATHKVGLNLNNHSNLVF